MLAVGDARPRLPTRLWGHHGQPVAAAGPAGHLPHARLPPLRHLPPGRGVRAPAQLPAQLV